MVHTEVKAPALDTLLEKVLQKAENQGLRSLSPPSCGGGEDDVVVVVSNLRAFSFRSLL